MQALLNLVAMFAIAYWMSNRWADSDKTSYWSGLVVRLTGGIAIKLVYDHIYNIPGDTTAFFKDALDLEALFRSDPLEYFRLVFTSGGSRSAFFAKLVSVVEIISSSYYLTSMWFSLFSFLCCYRLVMKLDQVFPYLKIASRIALLFTPSVVFWTSGIIKESVAFGAVAMLVFYFLSFMRGQRSNWKSVIWILVFLYILVSLKYYWAAVLIPSMISGIVIHRFIENRFDDKWIIIGSWFIVFFFLLIITSFTHPNFYADRFLPMIIESHDQFVRLSQPQNLIGYNNLSANIISLLINSPLALISGLFRPTIFGTSGIPGHLAAIENLVLLVLVLWKLRSIRMPMYENRSIVLTTVVYIIVLCIFLALSTPNLGTLSRYRVGFLPFFVLLILADHPLLKSFESFKSLKSTDGESSDNLRSEPPRAVGSRDI